jgi:hypothetical protein
MGSNEKASILVSVVYGMNGGAWGSIISAYNAAAPLRTRLPEPRPVRGPPRPADGQTSGLILSGPRGGALQ